MFGGNQKHFQKKSLKLAIERDSRSRSLNGQYRSDSVGDGAKELQLVVFYIIYRPFHVKKKQ
jgi:hypothetical protein